MAHVAARRRADHRREITNPNANLVAAIANIVPSRIRHLVATPIMTAAMLRVAQNTTVNRWLDPSRSAISKQGANTTL
jgi:hypothetical protein